MINSFLFERIRHKNDNYAEHSLITFDQTPIYQRFKEHSTAKPNFRFSDIRADQNAPSIKLKVNAI